MFKPVSSLILICAFASTGHAQSAFEIFEESETCIADTGQEKYSSCKQSLSDSTLQLQNQDIIYLDRMLLLQTQSTAWINIAAFYEANENYIRSCRAIEAWVQSRNKLESFIHALNGVNDADDLKQMFLDTEVDEQYVLQSCRKEYGAMRALTLPEL